MTSPLNSAVKGDAHTSIADQYSAIITNPAFDPRVYSTHPDYAGVQQGLLLRSSSSSTIGAITDPTSSGSSVPLPSDVPDSVKLRFLFNPSDYTMGYTPTDQLILNPGAAGDTVSAATLLGASTTTSQFNLLFDRTYEVFSGKAPSGVNIDTQVFTQLLGVPANGNGFPLFLPVQLYLGGINALAFYGVISSSQITYTHFTKTMVPLRAAISISMTQWIDATPGPSGTASKTTGVFSAPRAGVLPVPFTSKNPPITQDPSIFLPKAH